MPLQEGVIMEHLSQRGIVTMMPGQQIIVEKRGGQVNHPVFSISQKIRHDVILKQINLNLEQCFIT